MTYYFGSKEQINGDIKYNEYNFAEALKYYKKGLEHLHKIAAQRNFTANKLYNDALAYALSDVVICTTDVLRASLKGKLDYSQITEAWKEITSTLQELKVVYNSDSIQRYSGSQTTPERMDTVYSAIALAAEAVSDRLVDWLDNSKKKPTEKQFLTALTWLTRAIDNQSQAGFDVEIELHIGYLNLLERAFHCEKNKQILTRIANYIKNNSLYDLELSPEEKLELLGYELLVAVENNDPSAHELAKQCRALIDTDTMIDEESELITDLRKLMTRLPLVDDDEDVVIIWKEKKRKRRYIIEDDEEETQTATPTEIPDTVIESKSKHKKANDIESEWQALVSTADVEDSEPMSDLNIHIATASEFLVTTERFAPAPTTSLLTMRNTFFAPEAITSQVSSLAPIGHHKAFKKAMYSIAENYNSPGFLANLLSVFADFYYKTRDLPFKNLPITAYSLYSTVLKLNPQHEVAISRMNAIYQNNPRMINDNMHFAASAPSLATNPHDIFIDAIKDNIREIETYLSGKPKELDDLFTRFMLFVTKTIKEARIAGNQSALIAELLQSKYDNFILTASLSQFSDTSRMTF